MRQEMLGLWSDSITSADSDYGRRFAPIPTPISKPARHFLSVQFRRENRDRLIPAARQALARIESDFDLHERDTAARAYDEALTVVSGAQFSTPPWIGVTDDGIVMLQWQTDTEGVMLSFSGDGVYSSAVKSGPNGFYTPNYQEHNVVDQLPDSITDEIARLSGVRIAT